MTTREGEGDPRRPGGDPRTHGGKRRRGRPQDTPRSPRSSSGKRSRGRPQETWRRPVDPWRLKRSRETQGDGGFPWTLGGKTTREEDPRILRGPLTAKEKQRETPRDLEETRGPLVIREGEEDPRIYLEIRGPLTAREVEGRPRDTGHLRTHE